MAEHAENSGKPEPAVPARDASLSPAVCRELEEFISVAKEAFAWRAGEV